MTLPILLGIVTLAALGAVLWTLWRMVRSPLPREVQEAQERKEQARLDALQRTFAERIGEEVRRVWDQVQGQVRTTEESVSQKLQQANDTMTQVTRELGRLQEATRKVEEVGRNVATLEDLLRAPKIRGGLGEFLLADLLAQIMPADFFRLQHEFSDGERVDAVIRVEERLVPVDAKFPLEAFRRMGQAVTDEERNQLRRLLARDMKQHVDSIARKYIRPSEGTFDFALMYIPAENVYYEAIIRDEGVCEEGFFQHAVGRRVIPVSPNSFYAYLLVILQGLRGFAVERQAREILGSLIKLQRELSAVREDFDRAGKQLGFAAENFERAQKHLTRFETRLEAIEAPPEQVSEAVEMSPAEERGNDG